MNFVKSQILNKLADLYPNFLKKDLEKALNLVFDEIIQALCMGKNVQIRGFGSFKIKHLKFRIGRNPRDGTKVEIPAKKTIHWKTSKEFFKKINQDINHDS